MHIMPFMTFSMGLSNAKHYILQSEEKYPHGVLNTVPSFTTDLYLHHLILQVNLLL